MIRKPTVFNYKNYVDLLKRTRWIPVSERLPDVDVEVLTTTDWSDVLIAWLGKGGAWETEELILDNDEILAWMPLPEPYKGGIQNDQIHKRNGYK